MYILQVAPKLVLALIVLLIYVKISGKSQLAPMSQLDQVGNMVIGAIVGAAFLNTSISAWESTAVVSFWAALLLIIRFVKSHNTRARDIIDGKAIQLVADGQMLTENFQKVKLIVRDFEILMNQGGAKSISELKNVWFETNGSLTIILKGEADASTMLIEEGCINTDNLKELNKTDEWLNKELFRQSYRDTKDIFCAEYYKDQLIIYPYQKKEGSAKNASLS